MKEYQDRILQCNIWEKYELIVNQYPDLWNFKDKDQDSGDGVSIVADFSKEMFEHFIARDADIYFISQEKMICINNMEALFCEYQGKSNQVLEEICVYMAVHDPDFFIFVSVKNSKGISISECIPFLESIKVDKDFFVIEKERLAKEAIEDAFREIYAFHRAMLGWTNEESHEWLMAHGHQDIYDFPSWFYHEERLYWAADAIIPEYVGNEMNNRGRIAGKINAATLNDKISCANFSDQEWQEARQRVNRVFEEEGISFRVQHLI